MTLPAQGKMKEAVVLLFNDGRVHQHRDAINILAGHFQLTEDERQFVAVPGRAAEFNRLYHTSTSVLASKGILVRTKRSSFQLNQKKAEAWLEKRRKPRREDYRPSKVPFEVPSTGIKELAEAVVQLTASVNRLIKLLEKKQ
jgi:restriction endonuclease Mrr